MMRLLVLLGLMAAVASGQPAGEPLRARLGEGATAVSRVLGVDAAGNVRLTPDNGSGGEVLIPLAEARQLRFVLPDTYRQAQQLAFNARRGEALRVIERFAARLVPYVAAPDSNAVAVVRFYFDLLLTEARWPEATALALLLPLDDLNGDFLPRIMRLARSLQAQGRLSDVVTLVSRVPLAATAPERATLLAELADEMRRAGHWAEAQVLYERLRQVATGPARGRYGLLLAYTDWHLGSTLRTEVALREVERPRDEPADLALYALLEGRSALARGEVELALDVLGRALVMAPAANEWRVETMAVLAAAYRVHGDTAVAAVIEADVARIYPDSPWSKPTALVPTST